MSIFSLILAEALHRNPVEFQVTVTDIVTMLDGRFNTFNPSFKDYFKTQSTTVVGPNNIEQFVYEMPVIPDQHELRFNLRKSRTSLLFAEHDKNNDYEVFLERFNKTLDAVSRGSKQVLGMIDGAVRLRRFDAEQELGSVFPQLNIETLTRIRHLYTHVSELDALYHRRGDVLVLWNHAVTFFESLIKAYLEKFPRNVLSSQS